MRASSASAIVVAVVGFAAYAVTGIVVSRAIQDASPLGAYMSIAFLAIAALVAAGAALLHVRIGRPADTLAHELKTLAQTSLDRPLHLSPSHWLGPLPAAAAAAVGALRTARGQTQEAIAAATRKAEEQKSRLEAILLDLSEGVIVCNLDHRILLYNQTAARLFEAREAVGLDRSVFGLLTREPILHMLEQLLHSDGDLPAQDEPAADEQVRRFVCATMDLGTLLQTRLSLVREPSGHPSGYVLTFADVGADMENLALRDALLREVAVEWRRPLASLTAATEMLADNPDLAAAERQMFGDIVAKEVAALNGRFAEVTQRYGRLAAGPWPLADLHSFDLFRTVQKHLAASDRITLTPVGVPAWLHADAHSLMLALEHLIRHTSRHRGVTAFDIEAQLRDPYVYIEASWDGEPVPSAVIEGWLDEPLKGTVASRSARQIIERHGSELWSQALPGGRACLRLPLRPAERRRLSRRPDSRAALRPEFYDFGLFEVFNKALEETPLRKLNVVVFDTETTGLRPNEGDELIAIGAVRVVNGRILTGETFERLINPGRKIPEASTAIHGITEHAVRDKPPARVVLPQFKAFSGDSVLVAYNAAFDMRFLEMKEQECGVKFDNPVIDPLLLAIYLQDDIADHSLSAAAHRFGIEVVGRHTALGDAMMTAAVFVKLLDLLEARGIKTLGQAVKISNRMMEQRRRQAQI